jgi:hypothetical protein
MIKANSKMRKLILALLLTLSTSAMAEWTAVAGNSHFTSYIDIDSMRQSGDKVTMWIMYDYKTIERREGGSEKFFSALMNSEFDCKRETKRFLDVALYSGHMGQGKVVHAVRNINEKAVTIIPSSFDAGLFQMACGQR